MWAGSGTPSPSCSPRCWCCSRAPGTWPWAHAPGLADITWSGLLTVFAIPLVVFGLLSPIGLPTTFAITFLYVWLFNRTGGSVLLTLLCHNSQGTFTVGSFGFTGADAGRAELIYLAFVVLAVVATVLLDRDAWRAAPAAAVDAVKLHSGTDRLHH